MSECPACNSSHYVKGHDHGEYYGRCYDCGYKWHEYDSEQDDPISFFE